MPADGAYVATLRLTAASLAARCDLTIDDIDDLASPSTRHARCCCPTPRPASALAAFVAASGLLAVTRRCVAPDGREATPDRGGFAWSVLSALASDVEVDGAATSCRSP